VASIGYILPHGSSRQMRAWQSRGPWSRAARHGASTAVRGGCGRGQRAGQWRLGRRAAAAP